MRTAAPFSSKTDPFATMLVVDPEHQEIDRALLNWAAWLRGSGPSRQESPMFRLYRSSFARGGYGQTTRAAPVQSEQAVNVEKIMRMLPEVQRGVLVGWYVGAKPPAVLCRLLGIRYDGLAGTLRDARTTAKNNMVRSYGARWAAQLGGA